MAMATEGITFILHVKDDGTATLKRAKGGFKDLDNSVDKSSTKMRNWRDTMGNVITQALKLGAVLGAALTYGTYKALEAASNLQEISSKFSVVFAGQEKAAEQWAQTLVKSYGVSTREARQYLSSIQDLLVPMGMMSKEAGILSNEIVKLSVDLGSFNNMPTAAVMQNIQSALVGEYESMKKYGIVLNATVVQQRALEMGLAKTKDELTAGMKAQAAYVLMVKSSTAAIGDWSRTQEGYANQVKQLQANIEDLVAAIGDYLLPYGTAVVEMLAGWTKGSQDVVDQNLPGYIEAIVSSAEFLLKAVALIADGFRGWYSATLSVKEGWQALILTILDGALKIQEAMSWIGEKVGLEKTAEDLEYLIEAQAKYTQKLIATKIAVADMAIEGTYYSRTAAMIDRLNKKIDEHKAKMAEPAVSRPLPMPSGVGVGDDVEKITEDYAEMMDEINKLTMDSTAYRVLQFEIQRDAYIAAGEDEIMARQLYYEQIMEIYTERETEIQEQFMSVTDEHTEYMRAAGLTEIELIQERGRMEIEAVSKRYKDLMKVTGIGEKRIAILKEMKQREIAKRQEVIGKEMNEVRRQQLGEGFSMIAQNFRDIAEAAGGFSKTTFATYKVFAIAETIMSTYSAAQKQFEALSAWPPAAYAAAALAVAAGLARVSMIAGQSMPSYDAGGISTTPGIYYSGVPEAHIPLKSGVVPVEMIMPMAQEAQRIYLTVEIDGEVLGEVIYNMTKDGEQIINERGITDI